MKSDYVYGSRTPAEIRDLWQTPRVVFEKYEEWYDIGMDAAASSLNALCGDFLTYEDDSLSSEWNLSERSGVWLNPPYSNILPWVEKAKEQSDKHNKTIIMLLPCDFSTKWASKLLEVSTVIQIVINGRISFVNAETQEPIGGNSKGSMIAIITPNNSSICKIDTVDRDLLTN